MKQLIKRTEIAKALNFGKYPVVTIDIANSKWEHIESTPVRVYAGTFRTGEPHYINTELSAYCDTKRFQFGNDSICLKNSFGYSDVMEMIKYANAPVIYPDSDFVLVVTDSAKQCAFPPVIMHTGKRVDEFCQTSLTVEHDETAAKWCESILAYADGMGYIKH